MDQHHICPAKICQHGFLLSTFAIFTILVLFIFPGRFVGRDSIATFDMTWKVDETPSLGQIEVEVIFTFVERPNRRVGDFSDELAGYLGERYETVVQVSFVVSRDFGRVR